MLLLHVQCVSAGHVLAACITSFWLVQPHSFYKKHVLECMGPLYLESSYLIDNLIEHMIQQPSRSTRFGILVSFLIRGLGWRTSLMNTVTTSHLIQQAFKISREWLVKSSKINIWLDHTRWHGRAEWSLHVLAECQPCRGSNFIWWAARPRHPKKELVTTRRGSQVTV